MVLLFPIIFTALLLIVLAVLVVLVGKTVREHARMRRTLDMITLQVLLPKDIKAEEKEEGVGQDVKERIAVAEQWLSTLSNLPGSWFDKFLYGRPVIVFEIVARPDGHIGFYTGTERRYADHLEKQIYAFYPDAEVRVTTDYTIFESGNTVRAGQLSLRTKQHLPIATYMELEADPMQAITGALAKLREGDGASIQLVTQAAGKRTQKKGRLAARKTIQGKQNDIAGGGSLLKGAKDAVFKDAESKDKEQADASRLTPRSQERVELVEKKVSQQQFDVNIRLVTATRQPEDAERVLNAMAGAFTQYDLPDLNGLNFKSPSNQSRFLRDFIFRVPRKRSAHTFSTTELASLFHFPLPTTGTPNIEWRGAKSAPVTVDLPDHGVLLGDNVYRGMETPVVLAPDDRRRHLYLIGQTGTGKTTLFFNMIVQDIREGHGVGVVDPHGDLIEDILLHIPAERMKDVILFDPKDEQNPLGFNILEARDPAQKDLVVNEVVQILQKLAARLNPESVGPMFEHYLRNSLMALATDPQATLLDVPRMFVDEPFRKKILELDIDPTVRFYLLSLHSPPNRPHRQILLTNRLSFQQPEHVLKHHADDSAS